MSESIVRSNFGLSQRRVKLEGEGTAYDHWFWESKSKKKQKAALKQAEIDRMNAETAAMQKLMQEEQAEAQSGSDLGKIALIGGAALLVVIGAIVVLKKRNKNKPLGDGTVPTTGNELKASELIV